MEVETKEASSEDEQLINFDIKRYVEGLRRFAWAVLAIVALAITGAVIYTQRQPNVYQVQASVQIEPRLPDLLGQQPGEDILARTSVGGTDYYMQQKQVLGSYLLVRKTVEANRLYLSLLTEQERADRKLDDLVDDATKKLREQLTVKYPDENRIMYVVVRNQSPQLAADIANEHIQTYLEYSKGLLSSDTKKASGALSTEFDDAEEKLRTAESKLYQFQKDNDLLAVTLEERQSMASSGITTYTAKLKEAHARRLEMESRLAAMKKAASSDVLKSPILLMADSPSFDGLRATYYQERNRFAEISKQFGPKTNDYQMQKAKVDDLYEALQSEADRMIAGVEAKLQEQLDNETKLKAEVDRATKESLDLGPNVVAYNELVRKKKSAEDRYNILRARFRRPSLAIA